jgi:molecular chaperone DnaK (HSP70)
MTWILGALVVVAAAILITCRQSRNGSSRRSVSTERSAGQEPQGSVSTLTVRLFANEVPVETLPLSLSIETLGGVSTVLVPRGTALPTVRRETFSTATDNQGSVGVHVLVGDHTLATDNVTVGRFAIIEIPAARRGVPMFEVAFAVDGQGTFRFSAKDIGTGKDQPVSATASLSISLSQARIASLLDAAKAEEARGEYGVPRTTPDDLDSVTVYMNELRDLVQRTRGSLKNGSKFRDGDRTACEEQLRIAERVLDANALPERASAKLNTLKTDELVKLLGSLGDAAKRCQ